MKVKIFGSGLREDYIMSQSPRIVDGLKQLGHSIIDFGKPDFIYSNDPGYFAEAIDYKNTFGGKLILNILDRPWHCREIDEWDARLKEQLKQADVITTISRYTQSQVKEYLGFDSHVIHQPIKDLISSNSNKEIDFLIIGRNSDTNKRAHLFEEMFSIRECQSKSFLVVGESLPHSRLGYLGKLTDKQLNNVYNMSKIVFCLSKNEGLCLPMIEAICLGIPCVICEDMTTAKEFAHPDFLVQPCSHAIFNKAQDILDNYEHFKSITEKIGRDYLQKFNKVQIAWNILNLV